MTRGKVPRAEAVNAALAASSLFGAIALASAGQASAADEHMMMAKKPVTAAQMVGKEKCYGIAKAGENSLQLLVENAAVWTASLQSALPVDA